MAIDPAAAYASAIRTPGLLPNAKLVVDHFHVTTLANDALTAVRRRVTWAFHDRRGRKIDPQWANRRRLLTARERLSDKSFAKMRNRINAVDPARRFSRPGSPRGAAHPAVDRAHRRGPPPGAPSPTPLPAWRIDSQIPELLTLATTID